MVHLTGPSVPCAAASAVSKGMKGSTHFHRICGAVALLASATLGIADDRDWQRRRGGDWDDDRWERNRDWDRYPRSPRGGGPWRGSRDPVTAAMRDLESVWRRNRVDNHEAGHFRNALGHLERFRQDAARGDFDRGRLSRALDEMEDLAQADQIHPRDRQILRQRLFEIRALRDSGGSFGYRRW